MNNDTMWCFYGFDTDRQIIAIGHGEFHFHQVILGDDRKNLFDLQLNGWTECLQSVPFVGWTCQRTRNYGVSSILIRFDMRKKVLIVEIFWKILWLFGSPGILWWLPEFRNRWTLCWNVSVAWGGWFPAQSSHVIERPISQCFWVLFVLLRTLYWK